MGSIRDVGPSLTTHERQQVPVQLAPEVETFVSTTSLDSRKVRLDVGYLSLKASSGSRWISFPAVSSAPTSTSREATRAPWAFSSSEKPNFERAWDIDEEVESSGGVAATGCVY